MKHRVVCRSCRQHIFTHNPVGALIFHRRLHTVVNARVRSWPASALSGWDFSKLLAAQHDVGVVVMDGAAHMQCPCGFDVLLPERASSIDVDEARIAHHRERLRS